MKGFFWLKGWKLKNRLYTTYRKKSLPSKGGIPTTVFWTTDHQNISLILSYVWWNMFSIWDSVVFPNNQNLRFELANSSLLMHSSCVLTFFGCVKSNPSQKCNLKKCHVCFNMINGPFLPHTAQWCGNWSCLGLSIDEEWEKRATLDVRDRRREAPWLHQKSGRKFHSETPNSRRERLVTPKKVGIFL